MKKYLLVLIAALFCFGEGLPTQSSAEARTVVVVRDGYRYHHHHDYRRHVSYRRVWHAGYWSWRHGYRYWIPGRYVVVVL